MCALQKARLEEKVESAGEVRFFSLDENLAGIRGSMGFRGSGGMQAKKKRGLFAPRNGVRDRPRAIGHAELERYRRGLLVAR